MASDKQIDLLLRLASLLVQIAIPFAIFHAGRLVARAQYTKSIQGAWNELNKLAIANGDNIRVVRKLLGSPLAGRSDDEIRKAYLSFVAFNTFQGSYLGAKRTE